MKKLPLLCLFSFLSFNIIYAQRDYLEFYIENFTGQDLYGLYVTASDENQWGDDLLPTDYFEAGDLIQVTIPIYKNTICDHDILITYGDNEEGEIIFKEIDFCRLTKLVFYTKNNKIYYKVE
jgi:hypothetical protein